MVAALLHPFWAVPRISGIQPPKVIRSTADFAHYVGLARTTVSRVLNGQPGLKQKTIDRVRRAMAETGFTPNAYALHLRGKRTATVGVCMESLLTPPAVIKLAMLQSLLRERKYSTLIEMLDPEGSERAIKHFMSMRVDAVVFIGHFVESEMAQRIQELSRHNIPHLVIDHVGIRNANTVALDRQAAMAGVIRHLTGLGHTYFGLLGLSGGLRSVRDRAAGIADGLKARNLSMEGSTLSLDHLHTRESDFEYGRALARSFLAERKRPTAFVALNDEIAIGAIHGLTHSGLSVPGDISVVGFNNQDICMMSTPRLTSVDQQIQKTIESGAEIVLAQIGQPQRRRPIVRMIEPLLIARESSGPAP